MILISYSYLILISNSYLSSIIFIVLGKQVFKTSIYREYVQGPVFFSFDVLQRTKNYQEIDKIRNIISQLPFVKI